MKACREIILGRLIGLLECRSHEIGLEVPIAHRRQVICAFSKTIQQAKATWIA